MGGAPSGGTRGPAPVHFAAALRTALSTTRAVQLSGGGCARLTGIPRREGDRLGFVLLDPTAPSGNALVRLVAFWHALYRLRNSMRHHSVPAEGVAQALRTELRNLLTRHSALQSAYPGTLPVLSLV